MGMTVGLLAAAGSGALWPLGGDWDGSCTGGGGACAALLQKGLSQEGWALWRRCALEEEGPWCARCCGSLGKAVLEGVQVQDSPGSDSVPWGGGGATGAAGGRM